MCVCMCVCVSRERVLYELSHKVRFIDHLVNNEFLSDNLCDENADQCLKVLSKYEWTKIKTKQFTFIEYVCPSLTSKLWTLGGSGRKRVVLFCFSWMFIFWNKNKG